MKAILVEQFGDPEVMKYVEAQTPQPGNKQVLIKVEAIGVNPVDTYIRAGTYPVLPELPYTPGKDIAGEVAGVGGEVSHVKKGDRVYASGTLTGAYAEYAICSELQVFPLPDNMDFDAGAAAGVPAATAWRALFIRAEANPGDRVLVHGASGSVGSAAVQFARASGLKVYGTASTIEGLANLEKYGVQGLFNHHDPGYKGQLKEAVPGGFDVILEMLANKNLETDLELLAPKGRVVVIGSRGRIEIDPRATMGKEAEIRGLALFNSSQEEIQQIHAALYAAMESGIYVPLISRKLPLEKASEAHELVLESGVCGKILLAP